jgi:hypothetical protein
MSTEMIRGKSVSEALELTNPPLWKRWVFTPQKFTFVLAEEAVKEH